MGRNIVNGNTKDFASIIKGILNTMCTFKRRKKGRMNVDDLIRIGFKKNGSDNLHISR